MFVPIERRVMTTDPQLIGEPKRMTATELRKLPIEVRGRILAQQAVLAEAMYRDHPELIGFEAFGPDDLFVDSSSTETL
jgi:hypothetical protein